MRDYLLSELPRYEPSLPLHAVLLEVCQKHGLTREDLMSDRRDAKHARARQEYYWRAKHNSKASLPKIGQLVNKGHHTVMWGIRRYEKRMKETA